MTKEGLLKVMSLAKADRQAGKQVLIVNMKKNKKFQKEQLTEDRLYRNRGLLCRFRGKFIRYIGNNKLRRKDVGKGDKETWQNQ